MFDKYKVNEDATKWRFLRREIFEIISSTSTENKNQKSFLINILDEIKSELKEDAEKFVLHECAANYETLLNTGYFKL